MNRLIIREELDYPEKAIEVKRHRMVKLNTKTGSNRIYAEVDADGGPMVQVRGSDEFMGHALFLSERYNWVFGKDSGGQVCAVPLKKVE